MRTDPMQLNRRESCLSLEKTSRTTPAIGAIPSSSYYRARYYDPGTGRFIGEDPNKDGVAGSLYMYVEDSPTGLVDPLGAQQLAVSPNTPQAWKDALSEGFAEAMNRLNNRDCKKLFCNKNGIDPQNALKNTGYRFLPLDNGKGAATYPPSSVIINSNGSFVKNETTVYFPKSDPQLHSLCQINFGTTANMRALVLLHELGHELGIFPPDVFSFINGRHTMQVLNACFKELRCE